MRSLILTAAVLAVLAGCASRADRTSQASPDDRARHEEGMLDCTVHEDDSDGFDTCCRAAEQEAREEIAERRRAALRLQTLGVPADTPEFTEMDLPRECR